MSNSLNAHVVLHKLAQALPQKHHGSIIIVGSLSAAAQLIWSADTELRTKDIDGMLAPNATAVIAAREIATTLINEGWEPRADTDRFVLPADSTTPQEKLPVVRLRPPGESEPKKYFLSTLIEATLEQLVFVAKMRWRIERDYQDLKQESRLGHYE